MSRLNQVRVSEVPRSVADISAPANDNLGMFLCRIEIDVCAEHARAAAAEAYRMLKDLQSLPWVVDVWDWGGELPGIDSPRWFRYADSHRAITLADPLPGWQRVDLAVEAEPPPTPPST